MLREVRECLESLGEMLEKAQEGKGEPTDKQQYDFKVLNDNELWALEALVAKAAYRAAHRPEALTLIIEGELACLPHRVWPIQSDYLGESYNRVRWQFGRG